MPSTLRGRLVMTKWNFERVQAPRVPQSAALSEATNAGRTNQCAPELGKHASVGAVAYLGRARILDLQPDPTRRPGGSRSGTPNSGESVPVEALSDMWSGWFRRLHSTSGDECRRMSRLYRASLPARQQGREDSGSCSLAPAVVASTEPALVACQAHRLRCQHGCGWTDRGA